MKISQLQPGQIVYNVIRRKMGNTTLRTTGVFSIRVVEVRTNQGKYDTGVPISDYVLASWNGNRPEKF